MLLASTRKNGFLCYAHRGGKSPSREYVEKLRLHLNSVQPQHEHQAWCDQDLKGGECWPTEIRNALDGAAYAVLFVNVEFLNSEFITEVELPSLLDAAQREGLLLLPLLVGDCLLPDWLARIQFQNLEEGPLDSMRSPRRNRILRRFLSTKLPAYLSFRPPAVLHKGLHSWAMRPFARLAGRRKSCAIW
jgi:hypothetical protein